MAARLFNAKKMAGGRSRSLCSLCLNLWANVRFNAFWLRPILARITRSILEVGELTARKRGRLRSKSCSLKSATASETRFALSFGCGSVYRRYSTGGGLAGAFGPRRSAQSGRRIHYRRRPLAYAIRLSQESSISRVMTPTFWPCESSTIMVFADFADISSKDARLAFSATVKLLSGSGS